ncbi:MULTISPECIES: hypothetical protein [unclassified Halobacteriovorax]|uniref:hypothetical protein n=1 Tax=unclassified Halobacteriovorax TaxID=2639665 RepID=UPI00399C40CC
MKKIVLSFIAVFQFINVNALNLSLVGETGGNSNTLPIERIKEIYDFDKDKWNIGDYSYDSYLNRWILKTKTRVLSVDSIEMVDMYTDKQTEVLNVSNDFKNKYKNKVPAKLLEKRLKMKVKFKDYKIDDFKY